MHIDTTNLPPTSLHPNLSQFNPTHLTLTQEDESDTESDSDIDTKSASNTDISDYDLEENSSKYTSFEKESLNLELICLAFSPIFVFQKK